MKQLFTVHTEYGTIVKCLRCSALQCVAVCCRVLQGVIVYCSVQQCVLQCVAG